MKKKTNKRIMDEIPKCLKSEDGVHDFVEDEMFASGAFVAISGSPKDLGEETRIYCKKCGYVKYVRVKDLGSIMDIYNSTK